MAVDVTGLLKLKHTQLHAAVKKYGSAATLAEKLGVSQGTIGKWYALELCPPAGPNGYWPQERFEELQKNFLLHIGCTIEEAYPQELRDAVAKNSKPLKFEREMKVRSLALEDYAKRQTARLTWEDPSERAELRESADVINKALEILTCREREIIKLRYGLNGGPTYTLEEIGHIFKTTRERIRQIEAKAIRKLEADKFRLDLIDCTDEGAGYTTSQKAKFEKLEREGWHLSYASQPDD